MRSARIWSAVRPFSYDVPVDAVCSRFLLKSVFVFCLRLLFSCESGFKCNYL